MPPKKTDKQTDNRHQNSAEHLRPHWWKPGQSGNPNGRPPMGCSIAELIRKKVSEPAPIRVIDQVATLIHGADSQLSAAALKEKEAWKKRNVTWGDCQVERMFFRGMTPQGDIMQKTIVEYVDGKPVQPIAGHDGGALFSREERTAELNRLTTDQLRLYRELLAVMEGRSGNGDEP